MAENSKADEAEQALKAQLQFAVREIEGSENLRALLRHFLSICHVLPPSSVFDVNPVQNAYNQGLQAAGLLLAEILTSVEPRMVPTLMLEELTSNENV